MKVMGECLSCFGRTADASENAEPNPFVLVKTERERDGTRPGRGGLGQGGEAEKVAFGAECY